MKQTVIIGPLHFKKNDMIGSVIRTRSIYNELLKKHNPSLIKYVDIWGGYRRIAIIFLELLIAFVRYKNVVLLSSDTTGPFISFLRILSFVFKNNVIYVPIGIRFPERIRSNKNNVTGLRFVSHFLMESSSNVEEMHELGFTNAKLFRNFLSIDLNSLPQREKTRDFKNIKMCYFSRITSEKGIFDAITVFKKAQCFLKDYQLSLSIYGIVDPLIRKDFFDSIEGCSSIVYLGCVDSCLAAKTLCQYDILLFPTKFPGEGIPGTLIHALASGILIVSSKWKCFDEMLVSGSSALSYQYNNIDSFFETLVYAITNYPNLLYVGDNAKKSYLKFDSSINLSVLENVLI